ncbi:MAG TPA: lysozyme [Caulobacteraceae bacterium]|nr:lysozyme [Caulobacteraceae bacterium]
MDLIKVFEGFRSTAARLEDGRWTIGYGHTLTAREGAVITEADAEALLLYDLIQASHAVNEHVFTPLTQNQFDALVSFVFNIGVRAFRGSPTLRRLNEGKLLEAALAMELWRKADLEGERIVVDALVRRRAAEKALFLQPEDGWMAAPTPLLTPKLDYDALGLIPLTSPVATRPAMDGDRAYAERAPARPAGAAAEEPTASETAAAAVIARLEAIVTETETPAASAAASEPAPHRLETNHPAHDAADLPPITFLAVKPRRSSWLRPFLVFMLGALGVGLLALAAVWGFQPASEQVLGVAPRTAGLVLGGGGIVFVSFAAYFLLERLGLPRDRRSG